MHEGRLDMALSKIAKQRIKMMTSAEAKAIKKSVTLLQRDHLIGSKRAAEITRFVERHHRV